MLEIVFSDSACGSLKAAQHYGQGEYQSGCIGVFVTHEDGTEATLEEIAEAQRQAEEQDRRAWEQAVPLGGDPGIVLGFALNLSVGDISENVPGPKRQAELTKLYSFVVEDMEEDCRTLLGQAQQALGRIFAASRQGEPLRIWYSDTPDELCGFYWLMARLEEAGVQGPVEAIKLPRMACRGDGSVVSWRDWGEMGPGEWGGFLDLAQPVSAETRHGCRLIWENLQRENAPLRSCLNGRLTSVPADFYDCFLRQEIARQEDTFDEAWVLGKVLGRLPGVGGGFLAGRIEAMVQAGALEFLTEPPADGARYWRKLRKTQLFHG